MATTGQPLGPFKLVSVNTAPERAQRMIARICNEVKDKYTIIHAGNAASIEDVAGVVEKAEPDVLFCASMWTEEESDRILQIARGIVPKLKTYVVPRGMQVAIGPDATVDHVISKLDGIIHQDV